MMFAGLLALKKFQHLITKTTSFTANQQDLKTGSASLLYVGKESSL